MNIQEKILTLIDNYPLVSGGFFLFLGLSYLVYKVDKRESFKMKDYSAASWKALVNSWVVIFMLIIGGLFIIFRS